MIGKKLAIIVLAGAILSMAMAPDVLACRCRHHRAHYGYRRAVATRTYYYGPQRRVAGVTYYEPYHRSHRTRNAILTVVAPAAIGAGIGALAGGGKGAGIGALIGGGGGAAYYLIKHRHHRYY